MLIFDIETVQIDGETYIWEFACVDTITFLQANFINKNTIEIVRELQGKVNIKFYEKKQDNYVKKNSHKMVNQTYFKKVIQRIFNGYKVIAAYNINFDKKHLTDFGIDFTNTRPVCLWGSFANVFVNSKYIKWALDNQFVTAKGNIKTDAETAYKYVTEDMNYKHLHFALADCYSEAVIWNAIKKRKGKTYSGTTYRDIKKIVKKYEKKG